MTTIFENQCTYTYEYYLQLKRATLDKSFGNTCYSALVLSLIHIEMCIRDSCSVLADHAIKSAIYDYAQKNGKTYEGLAGFDPDADEDDHEHIIEE